MKLHSIVNLGCIVLIFLLCISAYAGEGMLAIQTKGESSQSGQSSAISKDILPPLVSDNFSIVGLRESKTSTHPQEDAEEGLVSLHDLRTDTKISIAVQPVQSAILLWNGKSDHNGEELMVVKSSVKSLSGNGAVLGIYPLPGKPLSLSRIDSAVFQKTKNLLMSKWVPSASASGATSLTTEISKRGLLFVRDYDNVHDMQNDVSGTIARYSSKNVEIDFDQRSLAIIDSYIKRGFRYFAFDVCNVSAKSVLEKDSIALRFKSTFLYYPLVIDRIGKKGNSQIDIIAITPSLLAIPNVEDVPVFSVRNRSNPKGDISINGTGVVDCSLEDFEKCDPLFFEFMRDWSTIKARNFLLNGPIDRFSHDFQMVSDQNTKDSTLIEEVEMSKTHE